MNVPRCLLLLFAFTSRWSLQITDNKSRLFGPLVLLQCNTAAWTIYNVLCSSNFLHCNRPLKNEQHILFGCSIMYVSTETAILVGKVGRLLVHFDSSAISECWQTEYINPFTLDGIDNRRKITLNQKVASKQTEVVKCKSCRCQSYSYVL